MARFPFHSFSECERVEFRARAPKGERGSQKCSDSQRLLELMHRTHYRVASPISPRMHCQPHMHPSRSSPPWTTPLASIPRTPSAPAWHVPFMPQSIGILASLHVIATLVGATVPMKPGPSLAPSASSVPTQPWPPSSSMSASLPFVPSQRSPFDAQTLLPSPPPHPARSSGEYSRHGAFPLFPHSLLPKGLQSM